MNNPRKNIVVTGAGGTLCSVIAVDLARQGHNVVLVGRSLDKLAKVEEEIKSFGGSCACMTADVKDEAQMMELRSKVHEIFGLVTVLIMTGFMTNAARPLILMRLQTVLLPAN